MLETQNSKLKTPHFAEASRGRQNYNFKRKTFLIFALLFFVLPFAFYAFSADAALVPCGPTTGVKCEFFHLCQLLVNIFNWLLALAGIVALLFLIWGAVQMVKGWIEEDPEGSFREGMLTVRRAIWGLVLVAGAFLVVDVLLKEVLKVSGGKGIEAFFADVCKKPPATTPPSTDTEPSSTEFSPDFSP